MNQRVSWWAAALGWVLAFSGAPAVVAQFTLDEGRLAWWQFDPGVQSECREISNRDADLIGPGNFVVSDIGIGRAARFTPGSIYNFRHPDSLDGEHWSKVPASGVLTGFLIVTGDDEPDDDGGTLVASWSSETQRAWRLRRAALTGELELEIVGADDVLVTVPSGATIDVNETSFIFWTINENDGELSVQVWRDGGLVSWISAPFASTVPSNLAQLQVGRDSFQSGTAPRVRVDLLAFWERDLTFGERIVLVNGGTGIGYAELFLSNLPAPGIQLERARGAFSGDVRHVFIGDSLVAHLSATRVPTAMLRVVPWPDLNTLSWGLTTANVSVLRTESARLGDDSPRRVSPTSEFGCEYDAAGVAGDHFGIPTRDASEVRVHSAMTAPPDGVFWTTTLQNSVFDGGATPRFTEAGDVLRVRAIHRQASDDARQYPEYRLRSLDGRASTIGSLESGEPRQLAPGTAELEITTGLDGDPAWTFGVVDPSDLEAADDSWIGLYGYVCSTSPSGQQFGTLGHDSWTWIGIGADVESSGNKRYSTEQFTHWLDATTVNAGAQHVFWIHCDLEDRDDAYMVDAFEQMAQKLESACATVGIDDWVMLILIPYMQGDNRMAPDEVRQSHHDTREAARIVANRHAHVCSFSMYDATDGVFFNGSPEALAWLIAHGYDDFAIGDEIVDLAGDLGANLLDPYQVHPRDHRAAAFFAWLGAEAVLALEPEPCPVDLDADGDVDFNDLLLVLAAWGTCDACAADFDASGVVDFNDIIYLLSLWGDCGV